MNYGKLTAGTTKTAIDTAKPSEKGEIITYLSRMGDVLHNVAERGKFIVTLIAVHAIGNGNQTHIVLRKKFLRQLADLYVVTAKAGQVFHEYSRYVSGLDCGQHFLKTGTLHGRSRDAIVYKENRVGVPFVLGGLLEYLPLILDAVGLTVHIIVTAQSAVERGCAEFVFFA